MGNGNMSPQFTIAIIRNLPAPSYGVEFGINAHPHANVPFPYRYPHNGGQKASTIRTQINAGNSHLTVAEALQLMHTVPLVWHNLLNRAIIETENTGNFFEMPQITTASLNTPFRAMLIGTNEFNDMRPNPDAFGHRNSNLVVISPSGTVLVTPIPSEKNYGHLNAFMANCTDKDVIYAYWTTVAAEIKRHIASKRTTWVSTHGLGVPWLHMRISETPRYYAGSYRLPSEA